MPIGGDPRDRGADRLLAGDVVLPASVTKSGHRVVTAAGSMVGGDDWVLATFDGTYCRGSDEEPPR